jgi:hypothetical protein
MGEYSNPARHYKPPGLLAVEIAGNRRRLAVVICGANWRFNRIHNLQLPTAQLDIPFSNAAMIATAMAGELIYISNRRHHGK